LRLEVIRVIDNEGRVTHPEREPRISGDDLRKLFRTILLVRLLDERMLRLQRQGRLGFYLSSLGEEATHIGAAHALRPGDWLYPAYREVGAALYRGYPLRTFMCQLFGNAEDPVKGRQMPVHHSIRYLNFVSISSPVATQIPHAVGTAWAAKMQKKDDVAVERHRIVPKYLCPAMRRSMHRQPTSLPVRSLRGPGLRHVAHSDLDFSVLFRGLGRPRSQWSPRHR
jgi:2-oxoisovalerate dehydrogenase E1 component alpha subunit